MDDYNLYLKSIQRFWERDYIAFRPISINGKKSTLYVGDLVEFYVSSKAPDSNSGYLIYGFIKGTSLVRATSYFHSKYVYCAFHPYTSGMKLHLADPHRYLTHPSYKFKERAQNIIQQKNKKDLRYFDPRLTS